jgi:hypothetical protein
MSLFILVIRNCRGMEPQAAPCVGGSWIPFNVQGSLRRHTRRGEACFGTSVLPLNLLSKVVRSSCEVAPIRVEVSPRAGHGALRRLDRADVDLGQLEVRILGVLLRVQGDKLPLGTKPGSEEIHPGCEHRTPDEQNEQLDAGELKQIVSSM